MAKTMVDPSHSAEPDNDALPTTVSVPLRMALFSSFFVITPKVCTRAFPHSPEA